jgi:phenylpropionate dioxygenase-like ring-hydroxylating dioxygenase large terminal subunit
LSLAAPGDMHDLARLAQPTRVHRRAFTDAAVFAAEMNRIYARTWVYLGHESELPGAGSYKATTAGTRPVLLTRDAEGAVHAFVNACRHRGVLLADDHTAGTRRHHMCPYHGWTYDAAGALVGVPMADRQGPGFDARAHGLLALARVETYRGFIFGSFAPDVPPLPEHLGAAAPFVDRFVDLSPTGRIRVESGVTRYAYTGNWKQQVENAMDGYHPEIVHRSFFDGVLRKRIGRGMGATIAGAISPARSVALGGGHALIDFRAVDRKAILGAEQPPAEADWHARVRSRLADRPGYAQEVIACNGGDGFNLLVYPNLVLINNQIRVIHPVRVDHTEVFAYPVTLEDVAPEINAARVRAHEDFYGPASFGAPDDLEMFQRQWAGLARSPELEWLCYDRGLQHEAPFGDGPGRASHIADETAARGVWRRWAELMARA